MGYGRLEYDEYDREFEFWRYELGVHAPKWAEEISRRGCKGVCAWDFYGEIFGDDLEEAREPGDYQIGEYAAIALEIKKRKDGSKATRRITVTREQTELYDLIEESEEFCLIAPISYAGKRRTNENARFLYALALEIDDIRQDGGIDELFYCWEREVDRLPRPTFIVCSGNGLHLYYVFDRPVPLYKNVFEQLSEIKKYFTPRFWNRYVTENHDPKNIQWESLNQPFRCVGTRTKDGSYAMAFEVGEKITLDEFNEYLPKRLRLDMVWKGNISLDEAKIKYPKWYQKRVVEGNKELGHWNRHQPIYYNWIDKIMEGAVVGHRYNCLENLCSLGVQCCIPPEQVEADCWRIAEYFDKLTINENNHFTKYDVLCALQTYHIPSEKTYRRRIDYISLKTGIELIPNKRNKRKQNVHLKIARSTLEIMNEDEGRSLQGRPSGSGTGKTRVLEWRRKNPNGKKSACIKETGLSKPTVYKWWDSASDIGDLNG